MATIRKPKMKKLPKRPKKSSSIETKERYLKKVAELKKENAAAEARYKKAKSVIAAMKKKQGDLEKRISTAIANYHK